MTILKALKHKYCLTLGTYHKYVVHFIEPSPTIYWYAKIIKFTFLDTPVLNTINKNNFDLSGDV